MCPLSTSTLFTVSSTRSLDVYDTLSLSFESSHNISTSSHPIITLLNHFNLLPCKVLVKKSAIIVFGRVVPDASLPFFCTIGHPEELNSGVSRLAWKWHFLFLGVFSGSSFSCHNFFYFIEYHCPSRKFSYQMLYGRYSLLPITSDSFEFLEFVFCLINIAIKTPMSKVLTPPACPLISMCTVWY